MPGDRNSILCSHCVSFTFVCGHCRLLLKNFCILCPVLNRLLGVHSQALTLQRKFKFHKDSKDIRCFSGGPGKIGEAHLHLVTSLAKQFVTKFKFCSCLHSFQECFIWQTKSRIYVRLKEYKLSVINIS